MAREAGHRTKIAVVLRVPDLNAKGACIGQMGQRVRNVMSELNVMTDLPGEKIDIIDFDEDRSASSPTRCHRRRWCRCR